MESRVSIWFVFSLFAFSLAHISSADGESESKELVLTLDHSNFSGIVGKHEFIVVEFYAPWCGHCKSLIPEYEKAASILISHDPPIILAKIDANNEANKLLAKDFEIKGFPSLRIFRKGGRVVQEYKGPRDADGIVAYLNKQSGPASMELKSAEDASDLIADDKVVVVGVFPELSGEEYVNFIALAESLRSDYEFGHTLDAKLLPRGESSVTGPLVRLFKPFDELFVDFKDFNVDALEDFVEESSLPIVTVFNKDPSNHPFVLKFFNNANAKAMLFLNFASELANSFTSKYHDAAAQYKGEGISFLIGDLEASQGAFQYFGLREDQVPLIIIQTTDGRKYLKQNLEPEQISPWLKEYKDGNVPAFRKSEPVPETNNEPVKVLVADTLQDMVFDSGKNVLIEFYAPWCGHCKKMAPILDEVALSYQNDADVIIAKLDATENDVPNDIFEIKGYPTLYFISSSGRVSQYEGNRTKEDILNFIKNNRDNAADQDFQEVEEENDTTDFEEKHQEISAEQESIKDEL